MRQAREPRFVATRGDVDPVIQQRVEQARVARMIGAPGRLVVGDRRVREEQPDQRERPHDLRVGSGRPEDALRDGEDYELLFAVSQGVKSRLETAWMKAFPRLRLTAVGRLVDSGHRAFAQRGFDHFLG